MRIRLKLTDDTGVKRINSENNIDNVVFEASVLDPESQDVSIFFKGRKSSGILNLNKEELRKIAGSIGSVAAKVTRKKTPKKPARKAPKKRTTGKTKSASKKSKSKNKTRKR